MTIYLSCCGSGVELLSVCPTVVKTVLSNHSWFKGLKRSLLGDVGQTSDSRSMAITFNGLVRRGGG